MFGSSFLGAASGAQAAMIAVPAAGAQLAEMPDMPEIAGMPEMAPMPALAPIPAVVAMPALVRMPQRVERPSILPSRMHTLIIRRVAIRRAKWWIGTHGHWRHMCLAFVRTRYRLPKRQTSAIRAWRVAHHKHRHDRMPPAGVPVFWSGGSRGLGHVAISLGHGWIVSTDLPRTGHVTKTRISTVHRRWGLHYLGWAEDLEGVRIYRR